ncbi:MAG: hypothetical protein ACQCN6_05765 [Candidatus Bathyarchaeia archaeon]|jgi:hypothetical protein
MLKRNRVLLIGLLISALIIPSFLAIVSSSSGYIKINSTTSSVPGQQVQAGGNVNLYFGDVLWSTDQVYLFFCTDGSPTSVSGSVYTPIMNVYDVTDPLGTHTYDSGSYQWVVGYNWINGSIPSTVVAGNYYIKAVDQITGVAVTDTYITVNPITYNATLNISPSAGPGGVPITFTGSGYPVGQNITITCYDPAYDTWTYVTTTLATSQGTISVDSVVPDLKKSIGSYDSPETYTQVQYRAQVHGAGSDFVYSYANYNEYARGLTTVGCITANGLFGNGTNLSSNVRVMVGDTLALSGKWFHPGVIYVRWDGVNVVGTVSSDEWLNANIIQTTSASSNGTFATSIVIPNANAGEHYLAIEDSQTRITVKVFITTATLQVSPQYGPGGATVRLTGSSYPASSQVRIAYLDPNYGTWNNWATTTSSSTGTIDYSFTVPDLLKTNSNGDISNSSTAISFRTEVAGIPYGYVDYNQNWRGLKQVGTAVAYGLFGNGTDLSTSVTIRPGNTMFISGNWFHPGPVYVRLDGVQVVGTVTHDQWQNAQLLTTTTASSSGNFAATVTVPTVSGGVHYIAVEDSQTWIVVQVYVDAPVIATPTPSPTTSPTTNPTTNPTPQPTTNPSLPTPSLDLSARSSVTSTGFKIQISGNLALDGEALSDKSVLLSYSVTEGRTWESLTLVRTVSDGSFSALWTPDVTGNYLVKATYEATSTTNEASKTINIALTPGAGNSDQNIFTLSSNSTITQFAFNSQTKELSFMAEGPSHTAGYVNIQIPKSLLSDVSTLKAYIDNVEVSFDSQSLADSWLITFSYSHSQHHITMELGDSALLPITTGSSDIMQYLLYIVPIAVIVAVVAVVALRKRSVH